VLLSSSMYPIGPKSEIQNSVLREIGHVVDDAGRLIAVVPGDSGDPAVFDAAPPLQFSRNHVVLTGSKMLVRENAGPLARIERTVQWPVSWVARSSLKSDRNFHEPF
jgi:hypothetical protein